MTTLLITCPLAPDNRGRMKPSFMLVPGVTWTDSEVLSDPDENGRVLVSVETDDPASILACEGVEPVEG